MKFVLDSGNDELTHLQRHLLLEGHEIVSSTDQADYGIGDTASHLPSMKWGTQLTAVPLQAIGISTSQGSSDYYLSRWWEKGQWHSQTFCGTPIKGTQDFGRGADVEVGTIGTWVALDEETEQLFAHEALSELLKELRHSGWVSLRLSTSEPGVLLSLECKVPAWGFYGILEGCPEGLGGFFSDPLGTHFRESWVCCQVISTWPWPLMKEKKSKKQIKMPCSDAEKHLWMRRDNVFRDQLTVGGGETLGIASSWDREPLSAWNRTTRTARSLQLRESQWRNSAWFEVEETWNRLQKKFSIR